MKLFRKIAAIAMACTSVFAVTACSSDSDELRAGAFAVYNAFNDGVCTAEGYKHESVGSVGGYYHYNSDMKFLAKPTYYYVEEVTDESKNSLGYKSGYCMYVIDWSNGGTQGFPDANKDKIQPYLTSDYLLYGIVDTTKLTTGSKEHRMLWEDGDFEKKETWETFAENKIGASIAGQFETFTKLTEEGVYKVKSGTMDDEWWIIANPN